MIVSRALGFVFVKAKKVGGTSVEIALSALCHDPADIVTPITPIDERMRGELGGSPRNYQAYAFRNHTPLAEIAAKIDLSGLRLVGVIRSPCGMVVSSANHRLSFGDYRRTGQAMSASPTDIRQAVDEGLENGRWAGETLCDFYRDVDGEVRIEPLRHERLGEDLDAFVKSLKPGCGVKLPRAKQGLGLSAEEAAALLRPDQRRRVIEVFAEDVERFGYRA